MQMEKEIEELKKLEQEALAEEKTDDGAGEKEEPKG
jgi:hypothetical protein